MSQFIRVFTLIALSVSTVVQAADNREAIANLGTLLTRERAGLEKERADLANLERQVKVVEQKVTDHQEQIEGGYFVTGTGALMGLMSPFLMEKTGELAADAAQVKTVCKISGGIVAVGLAYTFCAERLNRQTYHVNIAKHEQLKAAIAAREKAIAKRLQIIRASEARLAERQQDAVLDRVEDGDLSAVHEH